MLSLMVISAGTSKSCEQALGGVAGDVVKFARVDQADQKPPHSGADEQTPESAHRIPSHSSLGTAMAQLCPIRAVTDKHRELPPVHMGHSDKFFDYLMERSQGGKVLPTWKGEQYLNQFPDVLPGFAIVAWSTTRHQEAVRRGGEADQEMLALNVGLDGNTLHLATQLEFAKVSVVAQGPLCASVRVEVVCGQSRISVTVRGVFSSPKESIAHYPALVSTKLNPRSIFCFDTWVDWRQRTSSNWQRDIRDSVWLGAARPTHNCKNTMWARRQRDEHLEALVITLSIARM
ncbi:hypothetical protein B0H14DRAFT_2650766 [Mycena olivaceomarginata]|nr:hypothetical protein B0H14DRAFT_2650766 [Mycena olivaceomarginata]